MDTFSYVRALLQLSLRSALVNRRQFLMMAGFMFAQNFLFFALWAIFFGKVNNIGGWQFSDYSILYGIFALGVGLALLATEGVRSIIYKIRDGDLDLYLTRPRHPLPALLFADHDASSFGDIVFGIVLLAVFAHLNIWSFILAVIASGLVAILFLALLLIFQSLVFFMKVGQSFADQLFEMLMVMATIPQHTQGFLMKFVLFSVFPAGFMVILPVTIVRTHELWLLALLAGAVAVYSMFAVWLFNKGVRRYTSATGWRV